MDQTQQPPPLAETIPPEIFAFLDSLLMDAGVENSDAETYETMIEELYVRLDKFLIAKIVKGLPEERLEEFAALTEKNPTAQEVQEYLAANMPDAKQVFADAFGEFRNIYLTGYKKGLEEFDQGEGEESEEEDAEDASEEVNVSPQVPVQSPVQDSPVASQTETQENINKTE